MSNFYITTPIYYVNGAPHIGHAYTTIVSDALARYHRQRGDDVFLLTGTDEHGLKIQREAEKQGITPQHLADTNSAKFRELFDKLDITYDRFIRTTEDDHKRAVTTMVERMLAAGDIYLSKYEGWYSASDEAYYDESEVQDGIAIASKSPVEWVAEESYFFRLSNYGEKLLNWYKENPRCIAPVARKNEVIAFVEGGLRDLSISRTTFEWGIPMPEDPKHVLYVWVDALTNYISAIGAFQDEAKFNKFWPADIHFIGKDILRFHAIYWPAFLMSAGLELPRQIFAHGWWTNEGEKMSKSRGNFIDAFELADEYELDVLRYYLLREMPLGNDGNFSKERIMERNNSELADNLGNLVNRSFAMTGRFLDSKLGKFNETTEELDINLRAAAHKAVADIDNHVLHCETHRAVERLLAFSGELNLYIQNTQPWRLHKENNLERLADVLYHVLEGIRFVAVLSAAFMPHTAKKIMAGFGLNNPEDHQLSTLQTFGLLAEGTVVVQPEVLFTKFEAKKEEAPKKAASKKDTSQKKADTAAKKQDDKDGAGLVDFDAFTKIELRVGLITKAERIEGADRLLKLAADIGEEKPRTIVAGIAKSFAPEDLEGQRIALATNLKPAKLFGILSEAMILAAETIDGKLELARYSENVKPGTRIK